MGTEIEGRRALHEWLALVGEIDRDFLGASRQVVDPADVAEGEHMLLHLVKAAIDVWVDNDAARPRFAPLASPVLKWGGEGADNPAHCAPLDPARRYRITGRMDREAYVSFTVYTGKEEGDWNDGVVSAINHTEFARDADGRFSIDIGPAPREGALHMQAGRPNCVIARHYWEEDVCAMADPRLRCEVDIERLDEPGFPRPLSPASLDAKLRAAMVFLRGQTLARPLPGAAAPPAWFSQVPNRMGKPERWVPTEGGGAGAVDNAYCAGLVVLADDEALVVEGRWPACVYANVAFWNRFQQIPDYRYRRGSLNRRQMRADGDGRFRFAVAHRDPGVANWLDTEGHRVGTLYWRFLLSEGEIEQPVCRVVKHADVAAALAG